MPQTTENASRADLAFQRFERTVSKHRLQRYRRATASKEEAVALYLWNVALCEALYPSLSFFEVALRNALHRALAETHGAGNAFTGGPRWFMDPALLLPRHQQQVADALQKLRDQRKPVDPASPALPVPVEPDRVVAELSLGFWVNLCSNAYLNTVYPAAVARAFPRASRAGRQHRSLYPRLREALDLRNRAFHLEPLYHWPDLPAKHARICEILGWIEPDQLPFLAAIDRFPAVYAAGAQDHQYGAEFAFLAVVEEAS